MDQDLQYPIGKFTRPQTLTVQEHTEALAVLSTFPETLRAAVAGLTESQLDTPYRDGGWTVRQIVHHIADANTQLATRMRYALTENWPLLPPFEQQDWAQLADARTAPVEMSLALLDNLHARWMILLESVAAQDWTSRGFMHPINGQETLEQVLARVVWHACHHTAHITHLRQRKGW